MRLGETEGAAGYVLNKLRSTLCGFLATNPVVVTSALKDTSTVDAALAQHSGHLFEFCTWSCADSTHLLSQQRRGPLDAAATLKNEHLWIRPTTAQKPLARRAYSS